MLQSTNLISMPYSNPSRPITLPPLLLWKPPPRGPNYSDRIQSAPPAFLMQSMPSNDEHAVYAPGFRMELTPRMDALKALGSTGHPTLVIASAIVRLTSSSSSSTTILKEVLKEVLMKITMLLVW